MVSLTSETSSVDWPTPTVSTMITSLPKASRAVIAWGVASDSPPVWLRSARLRRKTCGSSQDPCMRSRSPSNAPPVKGLVGSTAMMPTVRPLFLNCLVRRSVRVLLPEPGGPVIPMRRAFPERGYSRSNIADLRFRSFSSSVITRDRAIRSPSRKRSSSFISCSEAIPCRVLCLLFSTGGWSRPERCFPRGCKPGPGGPGCRSVDRRSAPFRNRLRP